MKVLLICLLICLLLFAYIRLSKVEQSIWHIDPDSLTNINSNNSFLLNYANKGTKTFNLEVNALFKILNNIIINDNCEKVPIQLDGHHIDLFHLYRRMEGLK